MSEHFRKLERMYAQAPINRFTEPTVQVSRGAATISFEVRPELFHAAGAMHGSLYFKALDDAAFFAVSSVVTGRFVVTTSFTTYLLRPVSAGVVRCEGRLLNRAPQLLLGESVMYDERDRVLARGSGTFAPGRMALGEVPGYE